MNEKSDDLIQPTNSPDYYGDSVKLLLSSAEMIEDGWGCRKTAVVLRTRVEEEGADRFILTCTVAPRYQICAVPSTRSSQQKRVAGLFYQ